MISLSVSNVYRYLYPVVWAAPGVCRRRVALMCERWLRGRAKGCKVVSEVHWISAINPPSDPNTEIWPARTSIYECLANVRRGPRLIPATGKFGPRRGKKSDELRTRAISKPSGYTHFNIAPYCRAIFFFFLFSVIYYFIFVGVEGRMAAWSGRNERFNYRTQVFGELTSLKFGICIWYLCKGGLSFFLFKYTVPSGMWKKATKPLIKRLSARCSLREVYY